MEEKDLKIDRTVHAPYSKPCREVILKAIEKHYPKEEVNMVFEKIQHQYEDYLNEFNRKDLGGVKNVHNQRTGTYDCIMLICYYVVCKEKTSFAEIEEMEKELVVGPFDKMNFVDINKPLFKKLMYLAFKNAEKKCTRWHDYVMKVDPYDKDKPLHYCFTSCPFADFVKQFHMEEIGGALCNVDYASMEAMNVRLVRRHTCIDSDHCDYTFYPKDDPCLKDYPEYRDENGFIRNR